MQPSCSETSAECLFASAGALAQAAARADNGINAMATALLRIGAHTSCNLYNTNSALTSWSACHHTLDLLECLALCFRDICLDKKQADHGEDHVAEKYPCRGQRILQDLRSQCHHDVGSKVHHRRD